MSNSENNVEFLLERLQKVFLGFLPGGHAAEIFLNYSSELKNQRVLRFIESFSKAIEENFPHLSITIDDFTTEDFVDVFDAVIQKVRNTKSIDKQERFKKILLGYFQQSEFDELIYKYLELIDRLTEIQLLVLRYYAHPLSKFNKQLSTSSFMDKINVGNNKMTIKTAEFSFEVEKSSFNFYVNDLVAMGLLEMNVYSESEKISFTENDFIQPKISSKRTYLLSSFARNFLDFLKE